MPMTKQQKKKTKHTRPQQQGNQLKQHAKKEVQSRGVLVLNQRTQMIIEHAMQMGKATQNLLLLLAEAKHGLELALDGGNEWSGEQRDEAQNIYEKICQSLELINGR